MDMKIKLIIGMAVLFGITTASGAAGKKEDRKHQENRRFKQLIERFDKDKDGKLNAEERAAAAAAGKARKAEILKRFDKDKDGKLNAEERKALVKAMKARKGDKKPKGKGDKKPKGKKPAKSSTNKK
jgi:Ca2+-binding EF-hand superfamily protein